MDRGRALLARRWSAGADIAELERALVVELGLTAREASLLVAERAAAARLAAAGLGTVRLRRQVDDMLRNGADPEA